MLVCGVDEAGRGPLAGSVYAAAVILDVNNLIIGLADSKKLSEKKRDFLSAEIKAKALAWGIASCTCQEIDKINILQASLLAMKRAIEAMQAQFNVVPHLVQVDGDKTPKINLPCEAIVKGDSKYKPFLRHLFWQKLRAMQSCMNWIKFIRNMALQSTKATQQPRIY